MPASSSKNNSKNNSKCTPAVQRTIIRRMIKCAPRIRRMCASAEVATTPLPTADAFCNQGFNHRSALLFCCRCLCALLWQHPLQPCRILWSSSCTLCHVCCNEQPGQVAPCVASLASCHLRALSVAQLVLATRTGLPMTTHTTSYPSLASFACKLILVMQSGRLCTCNDPSNPIISSVFSGSSSLSGATGRM